MSTSSAATSGREVGRTANMTLISPSPSAETVDASAEDHAVANQSGAKGLFVGGAGAVKVRMADGNDMTFTGVVAGTILPIQFDIVYNVGTTATNMVALC